MAERLRAGDLEKRAVSEGNRSDGARSDGALSDRLVTPERSVFGTRIPRPVGVGRHLFVVILFSLVALGVAILFAERDTKDKVEAPAKARFGQP